MRLLSLFTLVCFLSANSFAKSVSVEWKEIHGAVRYELRIIRDGKIVKVEKLSEPTWKGDVGSGLYAYQIRAIDRFGRPGAWSEEHALVVMPKSPEINSPRGGDEVTLYNPNASTVLRWKEAPGASGYQVTVTKDGQEVFSKQVKGTSVDVPGLKAGNYQWKVSPTIEGRSPANIVKSWVGPKPNQTDFGVKTGTLTAVEITAPDPEIQPPKDGHLYLKWREVDGAEAYEVRVSTLEPRHSGASHLARAPAADSANDIVKVVKENRATIDIPANKEGQLTWKVRALANYNSAEVPGAQGPQSVATVDLNRNAGYIDGSGYVALSTMIAPYTYKITDPGSGYQGSTGSTQTTARLSGEYWFAAQWAIAPAVEETTFTFDNQNFNRKTLEIFLKYRTHLGGLRSGWFFAPKFGVEERDYVGVGPNTDGNGNVTSLSSTTGTALGPSIGFDLRKQLSERFSLGAKIDFFLPVALSVPGGGSYSLTGQESYRNLSAGIQGLYWMTPRWGLGIGTYMELRSISFKEENTTENPYGSIQMDSVNFYGSLIYSFGQ